MNCIGYILHAMYMLTFLFYSDEENQDYFSMLESMEDVLVSEG